MKILILNGSPKGDMSTTLYTVKYIEKYNSKHEYKVLNVGAQIKKFEKDFSEATSALNWAEVVVFAYPVYTFIAPSQLHRFIRLIKESGIDMSDKFATQITTSKHFYDVTAHNYIIDNAHDLRMKVIKGLSADMDDLLSDKGRKEALDFFKYVSYCVENDIYENSFPQISAPKHNPVTNFAEEIKDKGDKKVAIVADLAPDDEQLESMIERFKKVADFECKVINIHDFAFSSGCISCFNCAATGECVFKDGFQQMLREEIQTCDAIVVAFSIEDHSMGYRFKTYDDRQFCNGHRTVTMGMPFAYIVSGNLSEEDNLRMIIEGRASVGGNFLAGVATDEFETDKEIDSCVKSLSFALKNEYKQPSNFLGVGGMKIFRDLIWIMQGFMRADHKFYKAHGQYDFPQKKRGTMIAMYLVGFLFNNKKIRKKVSGQINEGMIGPYKKVLENK